jgi:hypothetical protein
MAQHCVTGDGLELVRSCSHHGDGCGWRHAVANCVPVYTENANIVRLNIKLNKNTEKLHTRHFLIALRMSPLFSLNDSKGHMYKSQKNIKKRI